MTVAPKISVIMSVFNGEEFLRETLDCVMAQNFSDWEMIIVNNCSTDGTQNVLDEYDDPRIRIISPESHGEIGVGLRLALSQARGEYVAVQDADDLSLPERLKDQSKVLDDDDSLGLVSGWYDLIDGQGKKIGEGRPPENQQELIDAMQVSNPIAHSACMFRRYATDQSGGYPLEYSYGCDLGLIIRLLKFNWKIAVQPKVTIKLRQHINQSSTIAKLSIARSYDAARVAKEITRIKGASVPSLRLGKRNITKRTLQYGMALAADKQWSMAFRQLVSAILHQPLYALIYLTYCAVKRLGVRKIS